MSIRYKILLVIIPLLVPALVIAGAAAAFSARSGITAIAQEFLQFKAEELYRYGQQQWQLLVANELHEQESYRRVAKRAVEGFAEGLTRRESELIFALSSDGRPAFATGEAEFTDHELETLAELAREESPGWHTVTVGTTARVAQSVPFEPFDWVLFVTEQEQVFYRAVDEITERTAIILLITLTAALLLTAVFTRSLLKPLSTMAATMRSIMESRDLAQKVPVLYRDEIGELGATFNAMTEELAQAYEQVKRYAFEAAVSKRQEQKVRNIFQKYVPADVIDQYFTNPESMLVGQKRTLAVLFSDVRSFTAIAERLPPDRMVESLNAYFTHMVDAVANHDGVVDKYIGDAIMAFFGAPVQHENDAAAAVAAGLEMLEKLREFNETQRRNRSPEFKIGIGINYGPVTIGNIGSERKMDYTVMGDMVNLAARLEGLTKMYKLPILISDSVQREVKDRVWCRLVDTVAVKGKERITTVYQPKTQLSKTEREAWTHHNRGVEHYYRRDFRAAVWEFLAAHKQLPDDPIVKMFLARCKRHLNTPPPPDWSGVVVLTEK